MTHVPYRSSKQIERATECMEQAGVHARGSLRCAIRMPGCLLDISAGSELTGAAQSAGIAVRRGPAGRGVASCMRPPSCTKSMCSNARDLQTFGTDEVPCKRETCREGLRFAPSQRRAKRARVCTVRTCRLRLDVNFDLRAIARPRVHLLDFSDRSSAPRSEGLQSSHRDSAWQSPKWSVRRTTDPG